MRYPGDVEDDPLLPIGQAVELAGTSRATVWRHIKAGNITPHGRTPGGHLRFRAEQLRRELAEAGERNRQGNR